VTERVRALLVVVLAVVLAVVLGAGAARAEVPVAVVRIDPLGIDAERALRLEALFRAELERMTQRALPSRASIEVALGKEPALRGCGGEPACLGAIGRKLGATQIVFGNVAQLGESYVVNLKLIDSAKGTEIRRIAEPLKGSADDLIEAVRVAAYRLVRPEELKGSLAILSDLPGALVDVDGKPAGRTPLARPIDGLDVGKHAVHLEARGYTPFNAQVDVRFQKTTAVEVRLLLTGGPIAPDHTPDAPWYSSPWMYAAAGAVAVVAGILIGRALAKDPTIDCAKDPSACMGR
jgi:hypothetical protein